MFEDFIIPSIIVLVVVVALSIVFKGTAKVDKGFKFNYFKLSYRRKMIRTLTSLPAVLLALVVVCFFSDFSILANIIIGLLLFLVYAVQLLYNFKMWKKIER